MARHDDKLCEQRYNELGKNDSLIREEIREIKDNHLVHIDARITMLESSMGDRMKRFEDKLTTGIIVVVVLALISGASLLVKVLEVLKVIP